MRAPVADPPDLPMGDLTAWREEDITGAAVAYLTDGRHQKRVKGRLRPRPD